MFCLKCGTQLPDGTKFCHVCGNPIDDSTSQNLQQPEQPEYTEQLNNYYYPPKKPLNKKLIGIIAGSAAAVIAIVVVLIIVIGGSGPDSIALEITEAWEMDFDLDVIREYSPVDFVKMCDSDIDELEEYFDEMRENFEDNSFGASVDLEVVSTKDYDIDEAEDFLEELRDDYGKKYVIKGEVEEAVTVKIKATVSIMGFKESDDNEIYLIKVDGSWYYINEEYLSEFYNICRYCS